MIFNVTMNNGCILWDGIYLGCVFPKIFFWFLAVRHFVGAFEIKVKR